MRPHLVRLLAGVAGGTVVLAGCLAEAVTYRHVGPGLFVLPVAAIVAGAVVAPFVPALGVLAASVSFPLQVLVEPDTPGIGGTALVTMMVLVAHGALRMPSRWSAVGAALAAFGGAGALLGGGESPFEFVFFGATMGGAWLVGWLLRRERIRGAELRRLAAALAAERERYERMAVVEERARISRELHDAVAHTVSVMTLQVGVVRRRLVRGVGLAEDGPECTALGTVEDLGRRSVDELRRVVGALHDPADPADPADAADAMDPAPSVRRLDDLVDRFGAVGLEVTVRVSGTPVTLAPAMDTSTHRIVTEALTNVLRHARTDHADVVVTWRSDVVVVEVLDRGASATGEPDGPGGHGLLHMRQRALLFGGTLEAGPREGGGYRVRAVLPLGPAPLRAPAAVTPAGPVSPITAGGG